MYKFGMILMLASLAFAACNRSGETAEAHDHETDAPTSVQVTLFSEQVEYFIEYDELVTGEPSGFLVHITHLETYDPVTRGSLTIQVADAQVTLDAPDRPGIFEAELIPGTPGGHEITYLLQLETGTDRVHDHVQVAGKHQHDQTGHDGEEAHDHGDDAHAAGDHDDVHAHEEEATHEHNGELPHIHEGEAHAEDGGHLHAEGALAEGEITFLKEQAWKSDFMVREVLPVPFSAVVKASGKILAVPGEKIHLAAQTSGMLVFRETMLVQGLRVEKGQPLFVILATSLSDDNFEVRYRELRNNLEQSRSVYLRHKELYSDQVISERQFIDSKTNYITDSVRFYNVASKASAGGLQISAPISGYIHELNFSEGQYVETGDLLVTLSSNEKLLLRADVPMQHYPMVDRIVTTNFRTGYSDRIYNIETLAGTLLSRGSSVAENDHFIPVYFEVTNDGTLLEGAFVEFFLKTAAQEAAIAVPADAIAEEQGVHYCYLQVTGESYTKQAVKVGENDGEYFRITGGLKKGDRLVTEGIMLLKAASMVTGDAGHGHAH